MQVNEKVGNSTPLPQKPLNRWTDRHQNLHGLLCRETLPYGKFHHDTITPSPPKYAKMRIKWLG